MTVNYRIWKGALVSDRADLIEIFDPFHERGSSQRYRWLLFTISDLNTAYYQNFVQVHQLLLQPEPELVEGIINVVHFLQDADEFVSRRSIGELVLDGEFEIQKCV
jgi:hypothetical protein